MGEYPGPELPEWGRDLTEDKPKGKTDLYHPHHSHDPMTVAHILETTGRKPALPGGLDEDGNLVIEVEDLPNVNDHTKHVLEQEHERRQRDKQ